MNLEKMIEELREACEWWREHSTAVRIGDTCCPFGCLVPPPENGPDYPTRRAIVDRLRARNREADVPSDAVLNGFTRGFDGDDAGSRDDAEAWAAGDRFRYWYVSGA